MKMKANQAKAMITKELNSKPLEIKSLSEYVNIPDNPAYVGVKASTTVNLGNYNSGKIEVSLYFPCATSDIDTIFEKVKDWVDKKLEAEYKELMAIVQANPDLNKKAEGDF